MFSELKTYHYDLQIVTGLIVHTANRACESALSSKSKTIVVASMLSILYSINREAVISHLGLRASLIE
jgi:hypothetical protein